MSFEPVFSPVGWFYLGFFMNKFTKSLVAGAGLVALSAPTWAVIDVTAATGGVADASTAVLAVLAAMITMAAAIYGVKKVLRLLGR